MFVTVQPTAKNAEIAENLGTLVGNEARIVGRCWATYVTLTLPIDETGIVAVTVRLVFHCFSLRSPRPLQ
ncbi:MAG: hypothetical protein HZA47_09800 [Planctomycetes bacterium]|nr:hypothetical protein [Planctomycetota bacterium]